MRQAQPALGALRALTRGNPTGIEIPSRLLPGLVQAGLGPLLCDLVTPYSADDAQLLNATSLTARVVIHQMINAVASILQVAPGVADRVVLLKGIAACQRHYPEPHYRLMGDIDVLVPRHLRLELEAALHKLGYTQRSELPSEFYATHHHSMPFCHPDTGVWVEVHTALFPASNALAHDPCFSVDHIWTNTAPITLNESRALVLSDELHLLYTCTHWASSLNIERGLVPMLDVIFLLRSNMYLDWQRILDWTAHSRAATHLAVMLGYLSSRNIVVLDEAATVVRDYGLRKLGRLNARLLYHIIDEFIVGRNPFGRFATHYNTLIAWDALLRPHHPLRNLCELPLLLLFPPDRADRFSPALALRRLWATISR